MRGSCGQQEDGMCKPCKLANASTESFFRASRTRDLPGKESPTFSLERIKT